MCNKNNPEPPAPPAAAPAPEFNTFASAYPYANPLLPYLPHSAYLGQFPHPHPLPNPHPYYENVPNPLIPGPHKPVTITNNQNNNINF